MYIGGKTFDEIYDIYAVRIIVESVIDCYNCLGVIHDMFRPIPNRFKDYISTPKPNMYQSLHTTVIGKEGIPFEVQIRTWEMHQTAEYGIAAHWKYKLGGGTASGNFDKRLAWIRQMLESQSDSEDVEDIVRTIKSDLVPEEVFVFTPKGDVINLPIGATVIDFAYAIHSAIGNRMTGAKVDGRIVPIDYQVKTGEIVDVLTSSQPGKGPSRDWLKIVKTSEARSKIRNWFKKERRDENIIEGKAELEREFKKNRIKLDESEYRDFLADDFKRHNCETLDDFYASIGYGGVLLSKIIPRLRDKYEKLYAEDEPSVVPLIQPKTNAAKNSIILDKIDDLVIKFAQCCNPLPGDEIVGFITRGYGISVHTVNCTNYKAAVARNNPEELARWCDIQWSENSDSQLQTSFEVTATDRVGLVYDISAVLMEARVPIIHSASRVLKNGNALFEGTIVIASTEQLKNLFDKLRKIKGVISVDRSAV